VSAASIDAKGARDQSQIARLILAYRTLGHQCAATNPVGVIPAEHPRLRLELFGLGEEDLERTFDTGGLGGVDSAPLREILSVLQQTYCHTIGAEYMHIQDLERRRWLQARMEPCRNRPDLDRRRKLEILRQLVDAAVVEDVVAQLFPSQMRFSLQGAESLIPAMHTLVEASSARGVEEIVFGLPLRGRLNVLINIMDRPYSEIFAAFEESRSLDRYGGARDAWHYRGCSSAHDNHDGKTVFLNLTAAPAHPEVVGPVVAGRARARQGPLEASQGRGAVLPLLVHDGAAFAGQGLAAEVLSLTRHAGYGCGGTVHMVISDQTSLDATSPEDRAGPRATDPALAAQAPIFHVNADDPEAVVQATELVLDYRQEFGADAVVELVGFSRHGSAGGVDADMARPALRKAIDEHPAAVGLFSNTLSGSGDLSPQLKERFATAYMDDLRWALKEVEQARSQCTAGVRDSRDAHRDPGQEPDAPYSFDPVNTGVPHTVLWTIANALSSVKEDLEFHPELLRRLPQQLKVVEQRGTADWALAEALAFGSLLLEGVEIRLSGPAVTEGPYNQRHAVWRAVDSGAGGYIPLNNIRANQARFQIHDSPLSEAAVLGFEYGYSLDSPDTLTIWEARFGDQANSAQLIIDHFITAAQERWQRSSSLVLLLPHGYEGQGPDHSSARLERFLAACARENIQICCPSTPAQYFHLLRRQVKREFRRPLVVMSPKSLLRHKLAVSPVRALTDGHFKEILDDTLPPEEPRRLVFCSGKLYYELLAGRGYHQAHDVALVRLEQLYPFNERPMRRIVDLYSGAEKVVWAQEEPRNRGAWSVMRPILERNFPDRPLRYAGRPASASPATDLFSVHQQEQQTIIKDALGKY